MIFIQNDYSSLISSEQVFTLFLFFYFHYKIYLRIVNNTYYSWRLVVRDLIFFIRFVQINENIVIFL